MGTMPYDLKNATNEFFVLPFFIVMNILLYLFGSIFKGNIHG